MTTKTTKTTTKKAAPKTTKTVATKAAPKTTKTVAKKTAPKTTTKKNEVVDPIKKILDPANDENIVLFNEKNEAMEFEQVAIIPYKENLYCILKPAVLTKDIAQDEAVAFKFVEAENDLYLDVVEDDETIDAIFDAYYKLFEESKKLNK